MPADSKPNPLYENLDTTFVNLWSLLRNLSQREFIGRVHVESKDYSADIFLNGSSTPLVHEIDRAAGTDTIEAGALHRVVLRARETPGTISVHEGAHEASPHQDSTDAIPATVDVSSDTSAQPTKPDCFEPAALLPESGPPLYVDQPSPATQINEDIYPTGSYQDWPAILSTSGELIGAVERAINASGENFNSLLGATRLELADDYSFLDPIVNAFEYEHGVATLRQEVPVRVFVAALSETLRRIVNRVAVADRARRVRERVALEMLTVARARADVLDRSGFQSQLDRIAGTRVM
ncbi:MAG TPA: hypothetical protein VK557_10675 [Pyrinomonadaceae bacterium]|nr:hypothetical protein [Pyrinomonadaceae bacterium]